MDALEIEGQKIFFSDARKMEAFAPESIDFIMTSPPYWNLKDYGNSVHEIGDSDYESYLADLGEVWQQCYRVAKPGAVLIINVNSRRSKGVFYPIDFDIVARMKNWNFWDQNIWYIPNALPQPNAYMERLLDNKFESILVFVKGDSKSYKFNKPRVPQKYAVADPRSEKKNSRGRCVGNIIRVPAYRPPNVKQMGYHVAAFPEELVAFFMESYTRPGDAVLDPFLGSGTTLKVARVMGRQGFGFEVHDSYRALIETRIAEAWAVPDWRDVDVLHSATMETGARKPRKSQFQNQDRNVSLFDE